MEESMDPALARLRAKTDRQLGILLARQVHRARKLACTGAYPEAAKIYRQATALASVANLTEVQRARVERQLHAVRQTIELPRTAVA
jgi:hypothetical protein